MFSYSSRKQLTNPSKDKVEQFRYNIHSVYQSIKYNLIKVCPVRRETLNKLCPVTRKTFFAFYLDSSHITSTLLKNKTKFNFPEHNKNV